MGQRVIHVGSGIPDLQEVTDIGNITTNEIESKSLILTEQVSDPAYAAGKFFFDGIDFRLYDNISGTSISVGKEQVVDVYNDTGGLLTNFTVVRFSGVVGGIPSVQLAQANSVINASGAVIMTHDVLAGEVGKATTFGLAGGDTSMWGEGDLLVIDTSIAGLLTNIEQPILSPMARVLVSDPVDGVILISPKGVQNITAIGQATHEAGATFDVTTTPQQLDVYSNATFQKNVTIDLGGAVAPYTVFMNPSSIGASGYYRVSFSISVTSTDNNLYSFEIYRNGAPSGLVTSIDLRNNNIDAGSTSFSAITQNIVLDTDEIEMYAYTNAGTQTLTIDSAIFSIERIGTV